MFFKLMMARPFPADFDFQPNTWAAEEKIDGVRILVHVDAKPDDLFMEKHVTTWSRYGILHPLPKHIIAELAKLPMAYYDGEVCAPGKRSYGATEIANQPDLVFYIFDIPYPPSFNKQDLMYDHRRLYLENLDAKYKLSSGPVQILPSTQVNTMDEVFALRDAVWARDGEGLILKNRRSYYEMGKRPKTWIKIKQLRSAVLTLIGFVPSKGLINDRGPYATVLLEDEDGNKTAVKTRNDALCRQLEKQGAEAINGKFPDFTPLPHPAIGRKLVIEYQERTPDGSYRHPRWDRWEDE